MRKAPVVLHGAGIALGGKSPLGEPAWFGAGPADAAGSCHVADLLSQTTDFIGWPFRKRWIKMDADRVDDLDGTGPLKKIGGKAMRQRGTAAGRRPGGRRAEQTTGYQPGVSMGGAGCDQFARDLSGLGISGEPGQHAGRGWIRSEVGPACVEPALPLGAQGEIAVEVRPIDLVAKFDCHQRKALPVQLVEKITEYSAEFLQVERR